MQREWQTAVVSFLLFAYKKTSAMQGGLNEGHVQNVRESWPCTFCFQTSRSTSYVEHTKIVTHPPIQQRKVSSKQSCHVPNKIEGNLQKGNTCDDCQKDKLGGSGAVISGLEVICLFSLKCLSNAFSNASCYFIIYYYKCYDYISLFNGMSALTSSLHPQLCKKKNL